MEKGKDALSNFCNVSAIIQYVKASCNNRKSKKTSQVVFCKVLCPWGCWEFIHKVGYVDLDTVIQQFIQNRNLYIVDVSKISKIEHTRDDYIQ